MIKALIFLIACTFFLTELYQFFPKGVYMHFYYFAPEKKEALRWYVTALTNKALWVLTLFMWRKTVSSARPEWAMLISILLVYRGMDFIAYILNASIAGNFYFIVYVPTITYALLIIYRRQLWTAAEWTYSKRNKNGNHN